MITNDQRDLLLLQYHNRGILKKEIRSYEVSLWTLQDDFMTVLKWSDVEQKGRIENPKMILNIDGTEKLSFSIPMYYMINGEVVENPNWYTINDKNLMTSLRKLKVIFNKSTSEEQVFEFMIMKITETHEKDVLTCNIEAEGLAFQELGKIGYKYSLSQDNFELVYKMWCEKGYWYHKDGTIDRTEPVQSLNYWCEEIGLEKYNKSNINSRTWYYAVEMEWKSFDNNTIERAKDKVYEDPHPADWDDNLVPTVMEGSVEKARPIKIEKSNLYNITQEIAKKFEVFCRYEYLHDANYHIIGKVVVFYNSFMKEENGALSFIYPYSSSKIQRVMDSTNTTTKLFVLSVQNNETDSGYNTIMDSSANMSGEDYILNFDYLYKIKAISKEQYSEIRPYEKKMRILNRQMRNLQNRLATYQVQIPEIEGKLAVANKSVDLDNEQITQNMELFNALDRLDSVNDGYVTLTVNNPDYLVLHKNDDNSCSINLTYTNKGIKQSTIKIYKNRTKNNNTEDYTFTGRIKEFTVEKDENNNIKTITFSLAASDANLTAVYLVYQYRPKLYYDNIVKTWQTKLYKDKTKQTKYREKLEGSNGLYAKRDNVINEIEAKKQEKEQAIIAFERLMGPALREGYWQPEHYNDYGQRKHFNGAIQDTNIKDDSGDRAIISWDNNIFDDEDELFYEIGAPQTKKYYPCIDLSKVFTNGIPTDLEDYSIIWKTTDVQEATYDTIQYLQMFSVGSQALIKYLKITENNIDIIKPVLMLIGCKTFSNDQMTYLKSTGRIEKYTITMTNGTTSITHTDDKTIPNEAWIEKSTAANEIPFLVYPRIKFSSSQLKTDTTNLYIKYNNQLLEQYKDYYILKEDTLRSSVYYPEYYITIKPEIFIKNGGTGFNFDIDYVLSNANTAIYLDAKKISYENAWPKASYDIDINVIREDLSYDLYSKLAQIVMINDTDLKFENVFGYISQLELDLDNCYKDKIQVKNYKTKFEDLFSTIVAQTENMKQNDSLISNAMIGNTALSDAGLDDTLENNKEVIIKYLDNYIFDSKALQDKLKSLFDEAGDVLTNANKSLDKVRALGTENAYILSQFQDRVQQELGVKVYTSDSRPPTYKIGDIWISGTNHYVATSNSSDIDNNGQLEDYGFVRTYNGKFAAITGTSVDIDADSGNITIQANKSININAKGNLILSSEDESVDIVAGKNINITGNKSVNIGGQTINIAAEEGYSPSGSQPAKAVGGINLVATEYTNTGLSNPKTVYASRVLIHPDEIYMAGSKITMLTGEESGSANAIELDGSKGIWIGSSKKISLFSGANTSNANVEISHEHIIFGVNNLTNSSAAAVEMTGTQILLAVGTVVNSGSTTKITQTSNVSGVQIQKDYIGLATGVATTTVSRSLVSIKPTGIIIGSATGSNITENSFGNGTGYKGSYVEISGNGVFIGSTAKLYVQTSNFIVNPNASGTTSLFYVGDGTNNTSYIKYSPTNGLEVKGDITATGLKIDTNANVDSSVNTYVNNLIDAKTASFVVGEQQIWASVKNATNPGHANYQQTSLKITDNELTIDSTGTFNVNAGTFKVNTNNFITDSTASGSYNIFFVGVNSSKVPEFDANTEYSGYSYIKHTEDNETKYYQFTEAHTAGTSWENSAKVEIEVLPQIKFNNRDGLVVQAKNFKISNNGNVKITGNITAATGSIGGWTIFGTKLYSGSSNSYVALDSGTQNELYAIWCGAASSDNGKFRVKRNGDVYINSLMVYDPNHEITSNYGYDGDYTRINFSDLNFKSAISLNLEWNGNILTATANLWGKFTQTLEKSGSVEFALIKANNSGTNGSNCGGIATFTTHIGDGGFTINNMSVTIDATNVFSDGRSTGYSAASSYCSGYNSNITIKAPNSVTITVPSGSNSSRDITITAQDSGSGGSSGCFIAGSQVYMADHTTISIEDLYLGALLMGYDEKIGEFTITEVKNIQRFKHNHSIYDLYLSSGQILTLTSNHPVLTTNGWKALNISLAHEENPEIEEIGVLSINDELITNTGENAILERIQYRQDLYDATVYNCNVEPVDTFIVNNIVVHNDNKIEE